MQLSELSAASGVSAASIKYYRREGILAPGERITQTLSSYGQPHLDRLALVRALREQADASIADVRTLAAVLDDPSRPLVDALEIVQAIALGLDLDSLRAPIAPDEDPRVAQMIEVLGWPDVPTATRRALDQLLRQMREQGIVLDLEGLLRFARPLESIALADLEDISLDRWSAADAADAGDEGGGGAAEEPASDDVVAKGALLGSLAFTQLTMLLRGLAHASHSIRGTVQEGAQEAASASE